MTDSKVSSRRLLSYRDTVPNFCFWA